MIFTGFSPNTTKKDLAIVCNQLLPWNLHTYQIGEYQEKLRLMLSDMYRGASIFLTDSGRSAISLALHSAEIKSGDEVIVQGFTCVVVTNAILSVGATPIFVDIDDVYCTDPIDVKQKITNKTKVIIVQHTFGFSAQIAEIKKIANEHNIVIIEDCAHALGVKDKDDQIVGTVGDMAILSFGVDKIISSVRGGALVINNRKFVKPASAEYKTLTYKNFVDVIRHIMHIPVFSIAKPLYSIKIGKFILFLAKKIQITNTIVTKNEKQGSITYHPYKLENIFSKLAYVQLQTLEGSLQHRKNVAAVYFKQLHSISQISMPVLDPYAAYLRFPICIPKPNQLRIYAKKKGIILGDWYNSVVAPNDCNISTIYTKGQCKQAELIASTIVNLPTNIHITPADQQKIIQTIKQYANTL